MGNWEDELKGLLEKDEEIEGPERKATTDYSIFNFKKGNRKVQEFHVGRLMKSIQRNNQMIHAPIKVNEKMEVIDGQHRLKALENLGEKVYYEVVKKEITTRDITDLQVSMAWHLDDYFHSWCESGYPDYLKLKEFMQKHRLEVGKALALFGEYKSRTWYEEFKQGNFIFDKLYEELDENVIKIKEIISYVNIKTTGSKRYLKSTNFWCAMSIFFNNKDVSYDLFRQKLEYKLDLMRPTTKVQDYLMICKTIYNWKNHQPIE